MASLSDVFNQYLGKEGATKPLTEVGFNCSQIGQVIGQAVGAEYAIPLIATIFWQAFMHSPAFPRALEQSGSSFFAVENSEKFIVGHGEAPFPRHDLLVFDPDFRREEPGVVLQVEVSPGELIDGWRIFARDHYTAITAYFGGLILQYGEGAAVEARGAEPFGLMVLSPPTLQPTSSSSQAYCPSPAWEVALAKNQNPDRTVGVIARDVNGREGVTTAVHHIQNIQAGTRKMFVGGVEGTLNAQDVDFVQDSCFIEITGIASSPAAPVVQGPLKGITPGVNEQVTFESWAQGQGGYKTITTHVTTWNSNIPWVTQPWIQSLIFTDPDSVPGDSGTALINGNGYVLGFSAGVLYQRHFTHSAWIWAESVFDALKLQY